MLPYLNKQSPFPPVEDALVEPNGLLAAGADLSPARLLSAYKNGIFPWYSSGEPILWWSPDPRAVFFVENFKVHKSVIKTLKKNNLSVTLNKDFTQVIHECAAPRDNDEGTWITQEMIEAYINLHQQGHAHSVEVWQEDKIVGGIYGVASGTIFCGESMFSRISNGSKIALSCLVKHLKTNHFKLIDCQVENSHLERLGITLLNRKIYLKLLEDSQNYPIDNNIWKKKFFDWQKLLQE